MARQHLINLHGAGIPTTEGLKGKEFKNGEIAVQHGADAANSALHILTDDSEGKGVLVTFVPKGKDDSYLGKTAKAADSAKLNGQEASFYATASGLTTLAGRVTKAEGEITKNSQTAAAGIAENKSKIESNTSAITTNTNAIGGLDDRLTTAESDIDKLQAKKMVDSFGGKTGAITLDTDASAAKSVKFTMSNNELQGTVMGLGDIVTHNHNEYASSEQGRTADSALQSVAHSDEFTGTGKSGGELTIATKGIALGKLSQTVQDSLGKANSALQSISASGDTLVSASASSNAVSVSATGDLKTAVKNANSALQTHQHAIKTITLGGNLSGTTTADAAGDSVTLSATIENGQVTNAMLAGSINSDKLLNIPSSKITGTFPSTSITHNNTTVSAEIEGLKSSIAGGTFFKGVLTAKPKTTDGYKNGDIIAISGGQTEDEGKEFICDGKQKKWIELGDTTAEGKRITALENKFTGEAAKNSLQLEGESKAQVIAEARTGYETAEEAGKKYAAISYQGRVETLEGKFDGNKAKNALLADKANTLEESYRTAIVTEAQNGKLDDSHASQVASSSALGHIKIGYTENGKNYPVELDSNNKAFVNVPWENTPNTDTVTTFTASGDNYITLTHSGSTFTDQKVTASTDVCTNIASASETQLADAKAVKSYVDAHDAAVTDHNPTLSWNSQSAVATIDGTAINVTMPAKPTITVSGNTATTGKVLANVSPSDHELTFTEQAVVYNDTPVDFKTMTIDCGEY